MALEKILNEYKEFQVILSTLDSNWEINERLRLVEFKTKSKLPIEFIKKLSDLVDSFEIFCNPFTQDCNEVVEDLEKNLIQIEEIDSVSIQLEKNTNIGAIDYYFFDKECALKSIQEITNSNNGIKVNMGIPEINYIETETISFIPLNNKLNFDNIKKRTIDDNTQKNIKFYLSNNKKGTQNYFFNPYAFLLLDNSYDDKEELVNLIKRSFYLTLLESLSDKNSEYEFVIRGEKSIKLIVENNFETTNYESFKNLFEFLISAKKYTEKYLIIKKVFSLYITDQENLTSMDSKLSNIWKTVNHYYDHYIEDNLKDFFKTKDQLLKEAMNVSKVIYEQTDRINTSIVASLLSIIILLVTTLYRSIDSLTIPYFGYIVLIFIAFSFVFYYLIRNSAIKRFELTKDQFSYFLDEISVMQPAEVEKLENTYLDSPNYELQKTLRRLMVILIALNSLLVLSFLIFLCIEYRTPLLNYIEAGIEIIVALYR
ncbi:hypothetical protein [Virgibacillus sp. YIM 98842]|uniref:hypothetical protein n=1 Tax=Virgibacillus sp. YIM 98842 TaxID=2663533 RepID=UPI0013DBE30C|nr:hypothetical protein [Virgibacillus sp. YIM 98842]